MSIGRFQSIVTYSGATPDVVRSDARMWNANQAARSQPYCGTMYMGSVVEIIARPSERRTTPTSTPFAGPTTTSLRFSPRWLAITFSKKARLTLPIGYFRGVVWSVNGRGLLRVPRLKTSSRSLRRYDPDQVPRVYPSCGILSALLGSPGSPMGGL